jgi:hypothetical protein
VSIRSGCQGLKARTLVGDALHEAGTRLAAVYFEVSWVCLQLGAIGLVKEFLALDEVSNQALRLRCNHEL